MPQQGGDDLYLLGLGYYVDETGTREHVKGSRSVEEASARARAAVDRVSASMRGEDRVAAHVSGTLRGTAGAHRAVDRAAENLRAELARENEQHQRLLAAAGRGRTAFLEEEIQVAALNRVMRSGVDSASAYGRELTEAAIAAQRGASRVAAVRREMSGTPGGGGGGSSGGGVFSALFGAGGAGAASKIVSGLLGATAALGSLGVVLDRISERVNKANDAWKEFEAHLVGVGKTANLEGPALESMGRRIDRLTATLPVTAGELLELGQTAGQLGVTGADNIERFAVTVAKLGRASNLAGEEGATALARILNVSGEAASRVDVLASILVELGNNFAATESEIAHHQTMVAQTWAVYDVGIDKTAALAAALASIGARAETGASATGRAIRVIEAAVKSGGEQLRRLEELTGLTGNELRLVFEHDAMAAFNVFLQGLRRVIVQGGNVNQVLADLNLGGEENAKILPVLAARYELLADAQEHAAGQMEHATALDQEYARTQSTVEAKIDLRTNAEERLDRVLGEQLAPARIAKLEAQAKVYNLLADSIKGLFIALRAHKGTEGGLNVLKVISALQLANPLALIHKPLKDLTLEGFKQKIEQFRNIALAEEKLQNELSARAEKADFATAFADAAEGLNALGIAAVSNWHDVDDLNRVLAVLQEMLDKQGNSAGKMTDVERKYSEALALQNQQARERLDLLERQDLDASSRKAALEALTRRQAAYNQVLAAGIDPASKYFNVLVDQTEKMLAQADAEKKANEELERTIELEKQLAERRIIVDFEVVSSGRKPIDTLPVMDPSTLGQGSQDALDKLYTAELERLDKKYKAMMERWDGVNRELAQGLQSALSDGIYDFISQGELDFQRFFESIADLGSRILSEVLANELSKALEQSIADNGGGISNIFSGVGGKTLAVLNTASIIAAADNQGYAAAGAVVGTVIGAYLGSLSSTGFGTSAGAAWGAQIGAWLGSMIKKASPEFYGEVTASLGKLSITTAEGIGGGSAVIAQGVGKKVIEAVQKILDQLNAELVSLDPGVVLRQKEDWAVVLVDGLVYHFGKDWNAAVSFAVTEILKRADLSGISDTMKTVLANTKAEDLDALGQALDFADWYDRLRLGDVAADLNEKMRAFGAAVRQAFELGLDPGVVAAGYGRDLTQYRNQILGIVETDEERIRRESAAFNSWVEITRAEQTAKRADLLVKKALLEAEIAEMRARLVAEAGTVRAHLEIRQAGLEAEAKIVSAEWELLGAKLEALKAIDEALAITEGILANLPELISPADIQKAINRARGYGGGDTGASQAEAALAALEREALPNLVQQVLQGVDAVDRLAEQVEKYKLSEERFADARQAAYDRLEAQVREAANRYVDPTWSSRAKEIRDHFAEVLAAARALAEETGQSVGDVEIGAKEAQALYALGMEALASLGQTSLATWQQVRELGDTLQWLGEHMQELGLDAQMVATVTRQVGQQWFLSIADGLNQYVQDEDVKRQLAGIRFDLEVANYQLQFQMLQAMGLLTAQEIAVIQGLFDWIGEHRDDLPGGANWSPPTTTTVSHGGAGTTTTHSDIAGRRERLLEELERYERLDLSPAARQLLELRDTFVKLREEALATGVDIERVNRAEQAALRDFWRQQLEPLRQLREDLTVGPDATAGLLAQRRTAQARVAELTALGPNSLTAVGELPAALRQYLDVSRQLFGGGAGYAQAFREVMSVLDTFNLDQIDQADGLGDLAAAVDNLPAAFADANNPLVTKQQDTVDALTQAVALLSTIAAALATGNGISREVKTMLAQQLAATNEALRRLAGR